MPTKDFLFDIGNVILKFDFSPAIQALADRSKAAHDDVLQPIESIKSQLESGQLDDQSFVSEAIRILDFQDSREEFIRIWCEIFELNPPMGELIESLAANGHRLFILSNTSGLHMDYILATYPVFSHFEDGVYSYDAKAEKPQPEIYQIAIDKFNLDPTNTIYIDDLHANVVAGVDVGLNTFHYDHADHDALLAHLRAHDIEC
ncbi:MAG: HAD family phosphatase [Verrucomicrobiota bacterium]